MFKMISIMTVLGLALLAVPITAQTIDPQKAAVPFAFFAGNQQMPAGDYAIRETLPFTVLILSTTKGAFVLVRPAAAESTKDQGRLVFNKYPGDRYFLREVWYRAAKNGLAVPKSRKEKEAVSSTLISGLRPERAVVLLAGK